jgi:hypothetical protein
LLQLIKDIGIINIIKALKRFPFIFFDLFMKN